MTSVDLMMAATWSPSFSSSDSAELRVIADTICCPSGNSTTTSAMIEPSLTETILPLSWLRALIRIIKCSFLLKQTFCFQLYTYVGNEKNTSVVPTLAIERELRSRQWGRLGMFAQELIDLLDSELIEAELGSSDQLFDLARVATTDDRTSHHRVA